MTPYLDESIDVLTQCKASVANQTYPALHIMVADGLSREEVDGWEVDHITLPKPHKDFGSTARLIGCCHAIGLGFDAIAFLDADNWYDPTHLETLVELFHRTGAGFLASSRQICRLDGSVMATCPITNIDRFVDTNCMMFTKAAFPVLSKWVLMPEYGHVIGDRIMLHFVRDAGIKRAFTGKPTVFFRATTEGRYRWLGQPVPEGARPSPDYTTAFRRWVADGNRPLPGGPRR